MLPALNIGRRMRLFMTADAVGGVWQYAMDLARALSPSVDVTLCVLGPSAGAAARAEALAIRGLTLLETGLPLDWTATSREEVANAAAEIAGMAAGHDVIHLNSPAFAGLAQYPAPVVAVVHSCVRTWWNAMRGDAPMPEELVWRGALVADGIAVADAVVAPSASFAAALQEAYALPSTPNIIHNGREAALAEAPSPTPTPYVLTAGRLWDESKGAATLDEIASLLNVPLVAAGPLDGPHDARFTALHLQTTGRLADNDVRRLMAGARAFVSAARYEPFGLAVLEAAQAGLPLVLSDIPTFRELWHGAAIFALAAEAEAFAAALNNLLPDETQRKHWGGRARERATRFTAARMAAGYSALYDTLLTGPEVQERAA